MTKNKTATFRNIGQNEEAKYIYRSIVQSAGLIKSPTIFLEPAKAISDSSRKTDKIQRICEMQT